MLDAGFAAALIAGLTGSAHCLAMCGGYAVAGAAPRTVALVPARQLRIERALTHAGRLATYLILGAAFGAAGGAAFAVEWPAAQRVLYALANVVLIIVAVRLAAPLHAAAWVEHAGLSVFRRAARAVAPAIAAHGWSGRLVLGGLWGLTPCALIYGLIPVALLSGGALRGALVMLGLWLGTLPALLLATTAAARLGTPMLRRVAAVAVAAFGVAGLHRALSATGSLAGTPFCFGS